MWDMGVEVSVMRCDVAVGSTNAEEAEFAQ